MITKWLMEEPIAGLPNWVICLSAKIRICTTNGGILQRQLGAFILGIGGGVVLTYLSPKIGIPVGVIISLLGIVLIIRAYRNRDRLSKKVKTDDNLEISYRDQKWGFPNPTIPNIDIRRMVNIGIDYSPSRQMQIAKISIKVDDIEYEAWQQHQFDIDKSEHHKSWFYLPDINYKHKNKEKTIGVLCPN